MNNKIDTLYKDLNIQIEYVSVDIPIAYQNNTKEHDKEQERALLNSVSMYGFLFPILLNRENIIIAGHARLEVAKLAGYKKIPVIYVDHLSEHQVKALRIIDNKISLMTGLDEEALAEELTIILDEVMELDEEFIIPGFDNDELEVIMAGADDDSDKEPEPEYIPEADDNLAPITKLGDVIILGRHILICGDSTEEESYQQLFKENEKADALLSDPPFNVNIDNHVCGNGSIKHDEFAMASGEMSENEFIEFLSKFINQAVKFSKDGSLHYIFMDWRHLYELISAAKEYYSEHKNICVWNKNNGGMGSLYRSKHEMVCVYKNGKAPHTNNINLGKNGRY